MPLIDKEYNRREILIPYHTAFLPGNDSKNPIIPTSKSLPSYSVSINVIIPSHFDIHPSPRRRVIIELHYMIDVFVKQ